jgi:hypothetical protein
MQFSCTFSTSSKTSWNVTVTIVHVLAMQKYVYFFYIYTLHLEYLLQIFCTAVNYRLYKKMKSLFVAPR